MSDVSIKLHEALKKYGSFPTLPVGIKMVKPMSKQWKKPDTPCATLEIGWLCVRDYQLPGTLAGPWHLKKKIMAAPYR